MLNKNPNNPIGIFDSGIGGLTVAKTITEYLPKESIVYFGDTAHTPWGDKSIAAIQAYSIKICEVLLQHHCKCIVIACHTASASAFELVKEYVGDKAHIINVIDPIVAHVEKNHANKKIGLIGTKQTIRSNTYGRRIESLNRKIELKSIPTPLLVPLIEEGFANNPISSMMISEYLSHPTLENIEALILGCTHYPLLKHHIQNYYNNRIDIIDACDITANTLKKHLSSQNLLTSSEKSEKIFYISDFSEFFVNITKLFFPGDIQLKPYALWE